MSIVTDRQRNQLLSLMAKHPELAGGFCHPYDRAKVWDMWKNFAKKLNTKHGCKKTAKKWRHYWADLKSKSRRKRANGEPLCDFDVRLLELAGEADGKRKRKKGRRIGASIVAVPPSPRREEATETDTEEPRLESPAQQEVSSSSSQPPSIERMLNHLMMMKSEVELIQLMTRIEEKQEEAEVRAGASSSRLLAVVRGQLAVQEQQIACLQQIVDKLLAERNEGD